VYKRQGHNWGSSVLPLTEVTVTLREGEVFMVSNGNGETRYHRDFDGALQFARASGCEGMPDAIVILTPAVGKNGINEVSIVRVHERAVAVKDQS